MLLLIAVLLFVASVSILVGCAAKHGLPMRSIRWEEWVMIVAVSAMLIPVPLAALVIAIDIPFNSDEDEDSTLP